jgi:hypothetical protein
LSLDAAFYWPKNCRVYGQYLVDEYYYEGEDYPKRSALLIGGDWTHVLGLSNVWLNMEYVRVDRWTYNYEAAYPWNRLNYYNSLLGHPIGPDADLFHAAPEIAFGKHFLFRTSFDYCRRGETGIDTPLNIADHLGETHPDFPLGIVEKTSSIGLQVEYTPDVNWLFHMTFQYVSKSNRENIENNTSSHFSFLVSVQNNLRLIFNEK